MPYPLGVPDDRGLRRAVRGTPARGPGRSDRPSGRVASGHPGGGGHPFAHRSGAAWPGPAARGAARPRPGMDWRAFGRAGPPVARRARRTHPRVARSLRPIRRHGPWHRGEVGGHTRRTASRQHHAVPGRAAACRLGHRADLSTGTRPVDAHHRPGRHARSGAGPRREQSTGALHPGHRPHRHAGRHRAVSDLVDLRRHRHLRRRAASAARHRRGHRRGVDGAPCGALGQRRVPTVRRRRPRFRRG